jgi:ABC-type Mn2+/Zn2+ transport system permease subunit/Mn-dependent DtxR family transcriptional regulator
VEFVSRVSRIKEDTAIGIMYTGIFAAGALLASYFSHLIHIDLYHFVIGMVLGVEDSELWMMGWVTVVVLSIVLIFFRQLQITSFDPVMAASIGISVVFFDYLLTICASLVVVSAVSLVGVVLVVGLLLTPAATAYLICDRLSRMQIAAAVFGVTGVVGGMYVSAWIGEIASGPAIVAFTTLQFLVVLVFAPRYGLIADWWKRRLAVPQPLVEDLMGCLLRSPQDAIPMSAIQTHISASGDMIRRGLKWLEKQELIRSDGGTYALTAQGEHEARRLLRAHRLWEAYLDHVGTPAEELHIKAHALEHVHDEETIDYLDDKLGHPLKDPHGSVIPEDFVHLVAGQVVKASLLRAGKGGMVVTLGPAAPQLVRLGEVLRAGDRKNDGAIWTMFRENGELIELNHDQADSIEVRLN